MPDNGQTSLSGNIRLVPSLRAWLESFQQVMALHASVFKCKSQICLNPDSFSTVRLEPG